MLHPRLALVDPILFRFKISQFRFILRQIPFESQNNLFLLVSANFELFFFFIKYIGIRIFMAFYTTHRVVNTKTMLASNGFTAHFLNLIILDSNDKTFEVDLLT